MSAILSGDKINKQESKTNYKEKMVGMMGWEMPEQGWRKGPWTPEEDKLLIQHVSLHGEGRWSSVADCSGLNRSGKSCRLRWVNYLRPGLKKGQLTPLEEGIIIEMHALWGNKWSTIARYLPGRTDNEIKNYWRTHFKKKAKPSLKQQKYKAEALRQRRQQLEYEMINKVTHEEEIGEKVATETQTKQEMIFTYPINTFEQQYWPVMCPDVTSSWTDTIEEDGFWRDLLWHLENDSSQGRSNGFFQDQVVPVGTTSNEQSFSSF